jgi:signal transduction histidine kinase
VCDTRTEPRKRVASGRWVDVPTAQNPPRPAALRLLDGLRWLFPLLLAVVAVTFEWTEHLTTETEPLTPGFYAEVLLFGVIGPVVVAVVLTWVRRLAVTLQETSGALGAINRDLEGMVAERTANLEAASQELADTNQQLGRANSELQELDRLKSDFVSLVSHQLRAPLTTINGALELLTHEAELPPESRQRTLRILTDEGQRLSRMIETILDISRIEAGRLTVRLGPIAVQPLLARVGASVMDSEAGRHGWVLEVAPGLPPVWADEMLLEEIVRNLVENAVRYSPPGHPIEMSARRDHESVTLAVADHGPGIPEEKQRAVFRSFYRLDQGESAPAGYGLGLYFADKLALAMGAEIAVESPIWPDPDAPGTRFAFTLPILADVPPDRDPDTSGLHDPMTPE